jgi:hypothetical protein
MAQPFDWSRFRSNVWSAKKIGDKITGTVVHIAVGKGRSGDAFPVVTLRLVDGSTTEVRCGGTDLKPKIADAAPQDGDTLSIDYVADRDVGQPSDMKVYEVECRRADDVSEDFGDDPF